MNTEAAVSSLKARHEPINLMLCDVWQLGFAVHVDTSPSRYNWVQVTCR